MTLQLGCPLGDSVWIELDSIAIFLQEISLSGDLVATC